MLLTNTAASASHRKDTAASILLQCVFELNRDEELDLFWTSYRSDVMVYPLFVLWCVWPTVFVREAFNHSSHPKMWQLVDRVKIQIHRRHLSVARGVLGEVVQQLSALLLERRQQQSQTSKWEQLGELHRSLYAE